MSLEAWIVAVIGLSIYVFIALWALRDLFTGQAKLPSDPVKRQTIIYIQLASAFFMLLMGALLVFAVLDENFHVFSFERSGKLFDALLVLIAAVCSLFFGKINDLLSSLRAEKLSPYPLKTFLRLLAPSLLNFGGFYWVYGSPIFATAFTVLMALLVLYVDKKLFQEARALLLSFGCGGFIVGVEVTVEGFYFRKKFL